MPTLDASSQGANPSAGPLQYTRRLYANLLEWYRGAETKAQIILSLDGVFVAFLTGAFFSGPADLDPILALFSPATWLLLAAMCVSLPASIACAVAALHSRLGAGRDAEGASARPGPEPHAPPVPWFFEHVGRVDPGRLAARLREVDAEAEIATLAQQIHVLSGNVSRKHRWVNRGFLLAGLSLALFLAAGVSYVLALVA